MKPFLWFLIKMLQNVEMSKKKKKKLFQLQYVQYVFIANVKAMLIMFSTVRQKYHNIASTDF